MFINMLKKEFIQFFRSKGNVFMMFIFPIILITTLSLGLKSMMDYDNDIFENNGEYTLVYYALEEGSEEYSIVFLSFKELVEDAVRNMVSNETIGDARNITSTEFYIFAELALIILYLTTTVFESVYKENTLSTINRIKLSNSSEHMIILAKVAMGCMISIYLIFAKRKGGIANA